MRTRVAIDCTSLLEPLTGVGVVLTEVLDRLATRDDLSLTCFAVTWRGRHRLASVVPEHVQVIDKVLPAQPLRRAWLRSDRPRIDRWIGEHDVVWGPNFVVPPTRARSVMSVHDLTPMRFPELCNRDTLQYPTLVRRALARGAWVHTDSAFVRNEVIELLDAPPDRVVAIPLGVRSVPLVSTDAGRAAAGGDRYVLALGTVEPRKDLPTLVAAFDELADGDGTLRLVIAGKQGWDDGTLDLAIGGARHRDRIVRLGYVDDAVRGSLVRGATIYAYPSLYEGFGLPPLEAMTADVPVVSTAVGPLPEVLRDGAVLVPPRDAGALSRAISELLRDESARAALVDRGRAVASGYSWDRCASAVGDLLVSIATS